MSVGSASIKRAANAKAASAVKVVSGGYLKAELKDIVPMGKLPEADADLVKSIAKFGLLEPLTLVPEGGKLYLISGEKRLAALLSMGATTADAMLVNGDANAAYRELKKFKKATVAVVEESRTNYSVKEGISSALPAFLL